MLIRVRFEDGNYMPAVNVKPPALHRRLPADLADAPQWAIDAAFEMVKDQWWDSIPQELTDEHLKPAFKGCQPHARGAGRSRGWVAVEGIGIPGDWTTDQVGAWSRFEEAMGQSIVDAEKMFHQEIHDQLGHL